VTSRHHDDTVKTCSTRRVPERSFNPRGFRGVMPGTPGAEESRSLPPSLCAPNSVSLMLKHISFCISLEKEPTLTNQRVSNHFPLPVPTFLLLFKKTLWQYNVNKINRLNIITVYSRGSHVFSDTDGTLPCGLITEEHACLSCMCPPACYNVLTNQPTNRPTDEV